MTTSREQFERSGQASHRTRPFLGPAAAEGPVIDCAASMINETAQPVATWPAVGSSAAVGTAALPMLTVGGFGHDAAPVSLSELRAALEVERAARVAAEARALALVDVVIELTDALIGRVTTRRTA